MVMVSEFWCLRILFGVLNSYCLENLSPIEVFNVHLASDENVLLFYYFQDEIGNRTND